MLNQKIEDNIMIITFEQGKHNVFNLETLVSLSDKIKEVNDNPDLKGIILTGSGRVFSAGFDIGMFLKFKDIDEVVSFFNIEQNILLDLFTCKKPIVSAINGHAVAGGLIFAMATDYRIIKNHPKIKLGMSEIKIGLPLTIVQTEILKFGFDSNIKYRDIIYSGKMYDVNKAKQMKIIDEIVEEDELILRAKKVISTWFDTPGRPFIALKQSLKKHTKDIIQKRLKQENWQDNLKCFLNKEVRGALEFVYESMK